VSRPGTTRATTAAGLVDLQGTGYLFELEVGTLLQASFPRPGDEIRVRQLIEADVGVDAHGVSEQLRIAYPIPVVVGTKPAQSR
jgi:hypothetical protein